MSSKLNGFEFWQQQLNGASFICAPMVDASELAFRQLVRRYNVGLCYTPMIHAVNFVKDAKYRKENFTTCPEDRPLIVQFCANNVDIFVQAAKLVATECDAVDLNLGCPQQIAKRGHYGAFLQDEWDLVYAMVKAVHEQVDIPITCKVRVFEDIEKTVQYARMLESAGCQLLTVHGRNRDQKGVYTGLADWQYIKAVKEAVSIPVFANGNIQSRSDAQRCLLETKVDGIMSAEGLLHNPALFTSVHTPVWKMCGEYLALVEKNICPNSFIRGHLFKMLHHCLLVDSNQDIRQNLAKASTFEHFKEVVELVRQRHEITSELQDVDCCSFPVPYYVCQPYFRPPPEDRIVGLKRSASDANENEQNNEQPTGMSKNKMKKLLKMSNSSNMKEKGLRTGVACVLCPNCPNPRANNCEHGLCKSCCKVTCFEKVLDCKGHRLIFKTRRDKKLAHLNEKLDDANDGLIRVNEVT